MFSKKDKKESVKEETPIKAKKVSSGKKRGRPRLKAEKNISIKNNDVKKDEPVKIESPVKEVEEVKLPKRKNNVVFTQKNVSNMKGEDFSDELSKHLTTNKQIDRLKNNSQSIIYIDKNVLENALSDKEVAKMIVKKIKVGGQAYIYVPIGASRKDMPPRIYTVTSIKERIIDHIVGCIKKSEIKKNIIILKR